MIILLVGMLVLIMKVRLCCMWGWLEIGLKCGRWLRCRGFRVSLNR